MSRVWDELRSHFAESKTETTADPQPDRMIKNTQVTYFTRQAKIHTQSTINLMDHNPSVLHRTQAKAKAEVV